ncbi:hypothetical protein K439DRAFT_1324152 [Ramaria rubella]|nr:hypothetical protein K439DRAFT_1324152 [Ramaria rubella]
MPKDVKTNKASFEHGEDADSTSGDSDTSSPSSDEDDKEATEAAQVLSHAAQRKLKRKEIREAKGAKLEPAPVEDTAPPKRQNSVWVGNLAFKTTDQSLRAFFQRHIRVCEVTRVNLPTKTGKDVSGGKGMRGENRGFAYVDFGTKEGKEQAIALSEQNLDGRKLLIKDGGDFTGRPTANSDSLQTGAAAGSLIGKSKTAQRILGSQKQPPAPTLFLGNLGFHATEESIREMLEAHLKSRRQEVPKESPKKAVEGEESAEPPSDKKWLRKIRLGTFEDSGLCKGWAFVDFFNIEDATAVLIDPRNHHLDGRKLVVEFASADAVRRGGGPGAKAHRDNKEAPKGGNNIRKHDRSEGYSRDRPKKLDAEVTENQDEPPQKKAKTFDRNERGSKGKRTKPGAALALAKREKVAIVPSSGKKIVF